MKKAYPKVPLAGAVHNGSLLPSAVLKATVLPHHDWMVFNPILPLSGYSNVKKIIIVDTATPESSAADSTSARRM